MKDRTVMLCTEFDIKAIADVVAMELNVDIADFVAYLDERVGDCEVTQNIIERLNGVFNRECTEVSREELALKRFIYWLFSRGYVDGYTDEEFDGIVKQYMKERRMESGN